MCRETAKIHRQIKYYFSFLVLDPQLRSKVPVRWSWKFGPRGLPRKKNQPREYFLNTEVLRSLARVRKQTKTNKNKQANIKQKVYLNVRAHINKYMHVIRIFILQGARCISVLEEGRKEMFYLTTHSTHFIYSYMTSDIW